MRESHESAPKPSPLLAVVALVLVHRFRPSWCATAISAAAAEVNVRPERLSRLVTRATALLESVIAQLTKLGRPKTSTTTLNQAEQLSLARALLEVAGASSRWSRRGNDAERETSSWVPGSGFAASTRA